MPHRSHFLLYMKPPKPVQHQFYFVHSRRDVSFVKLFRWILQIEVGSDAKIILATLIDYAQGDEQISISYPSISANTHLHPMRVRRAMVELQEIGLISRSQSTTDSGADGPTLYTFSKVIFQEVVYWSQASNALSIPMSPATGGVSPVTPTGCRPRQGGVSPVTGGHVARDTHGVSPATPTGCHGRHPYKKKTINQTARARKNDVWKPSHPAEQILGTLRENNGNLGQGFLAACKIGAQQLSTLDITWLNLEIDPKWKLVLDDILASSPLPPPKVAASPQSAQGGSAIASPLQKANRRPLARTKETNLRVGK